MLLSILIPTIAGREHLLNALIDNLSIQIIECEASSIVEVAYLPDDKEMTIGAKRQELLNSCKSEYFVMIDDDDSVSSCYIEAVLLALEDRPDCVTYLEAVRTGNKEVIASHRAIYAGWDNNKHGYAYIRTPYYKDVIKTEIAKKIGFEDIRYGEDHDFSIRLKKSGLIKTEVHLPQIMYIYNAPSSLNGRQHKERYGIR